jgi:predicted nucleotidyltransferase
MRPSEAIACHRDALLKIAARNGMSNLRVFGSVARGEDKEGSDVDLLVDDSPNITLLTLARVSREAEELTGVPFDIHTVDSIHDRYVDRVLRESRPL